MLKQSIALLAFVFSAGACRADVAAIPSWLPEDQRFEVEGSSSEIARASQILAAMRDSLHPRMLAKMRAAEPERQCAATNDCPSLLGPTLEWIVHVSLPSATNEAAYFESYKNPIPASVFEFGAMTNRAARLSYLPPIAKLSLVFDDGKRDSVSRAIPGVDYPGVDFEDAGSSAHFIRLRLSAPKSLRRFKIRAEVPDAFGSGCDFRWIELRKEKSLPLKPLESKASRTDSCVIVVENRYMTLPRHMRKMFVFVRQSGGLWGSPSRITIGPSQFGIRKYNNRSGLLESIDYGTFKDVYSYGEKDCIIGFTRLQPGMVRGDAYSNFGERIIDEYSDDRPKTTRKVIYAIRDGKICYVEDDRDVLHKNEAIKDRSSKW